MSETNTQSYGIDSHKLNLHPQRTAQWLEGKTIYPIYVEISPSGACNHRCTFCSMDFMGYRPNFVDSQIMKERIAEFGELGIKAIMFAGEGEPLLHKDICGISESAKNAGIDISFTTNAVLLNKEKAEKLLPITSWIKTSCNATSPENYAEIHQTDKKDYNTVLKNMELAVKLRSAEKYNCTLGFQCILLPESQKNLKEHAERLRDLGADYLVVKPYTHNPSSLKESRDIVYDNTKELEEELKKIENENFKIIFRNETMNKWNTKKINYDRCHALPFWSYIDSELNVWGCLRHLKEKEFLYGNLSDQSFKDIWLGEQRMNNLAWCGNNLDVSECGVTCRMNFANEYLHRLKNPMPHDNFI